MLIHLDLESGIGGFALAAEWAGFTTIGFVEIDKYCQKVLKKHWPNVPIIEDVRDVEKIREIVANATRERFPDRRRTSLAVSGTPKSESKRCNSQSDRLQEPSGQYGDNRATPESITLITAGFPCQPFSVAGKQLSQGDDRYLWPQTLTVIKAIKPQWVLLENVTGIINLALDTVLSDLEGAGYSYETLIIPACAVNAWHRRDRVWIVANSSCQRWGRGDNGNEARLCRSLQTARPSSRDKQSDVALPKSRESWQQTEQEGGQGSGRGSQEVTVADSRGTKSRRLSNKQWQEDTEIRCGNWWAVESGLGGMVDGLSYRMDGHYFDREPDIPRITTRRDYRKERLSCLGNAIVPQVAYQILRLIAEIES